MNGTGIAGNPNSRNEIVLPTGTGIAGNPNSRNEIVLPTLYYI